jgi:hypothetical protein
MRFRFAAFALHVSASALALTLILGTLYLGWYRWPGWYLTDAARVVLILACVDLALGPSLTAIIASPKKPRRELARDVGIIVAVQLLALGYGAVTLWRGRPLYYTYSVNRLELVQAADVPADEARRARTENPRLAPYWYSRPRWIWAPLPEDAAAAVRIAQQATMGGADVIDMPRFFRAWDQGLKALRPQLLPVEQIRELEGRERGRLAARIRQLGMDPARPDAMLLWSGDRRVLAIFDPDTLALRATLRADS